MMSLLQRVSEGLARKTTRRGLFGRGAEVAFGALAGAAAGTLSRAGGVSAGGGTVCVFPGPPCECDKCQTNGVCAKPCIILTTYYASGCWTTGSVTCCDCDCQGIDGNDACGCGSDYHNNPAFCPPP
jgi:hypothetical protein